MTGRRRWVGSSLLAYGLLGVAMLMAGSLVGLDVADRVERLATDADTTLTAAARSTRAAADSFEGIDTSLEDAGSSSAAAAQLARRSQQTLDELATAMELSIFGAQPLLPLADDFRESATLAAELATTLDDVQGSLGSSREDVDRIGVELSSLADEMEALSDRSGSSTSAPPMRLFVALLLLWLAIPVAASLVGGLLVLRGSGGSRGSRGAPGAHPD